jgi:hypothetical protein
MTAPQQRPTVTHTHLCQIIVLPLPTGETCHIGFTGSFAKFVNRGNRSSDLVVTAPQKHFQNLASPSLLLA